MSHESAIDIKQKLLFGSSVSLGDFPVYVLVNHLDRASFAVETVLGVDLETFISILVCYEFINFGRAKPEIILEGYLY
jgi:hypothetical protein